MCLNTAPPAFSQMFMLIWHHMVQGPSSHHGSEADDLAVADMRVRLLAGLKRYLHGKRLNGLLSSEVAISPLHLLGSPACCYTLVLPASRCGARLLVPAKCLAGVGTCYTSGRMMQAISRQPGAS